MSREVKRVPLDFDWPLKMEWKGYKNPYISQLCTICDGSGLNPETKQISDDWYAFDDRRRRWSDNITQDEVDALIEHGRLYDFTSEFVPGEGWKDIDPPPVVTAEIVNEWSKNGLGHDAINQWICVETRAKRLGVYGECPVCNGTGAIWFSDEIKEKSEQWYDAERYDPPTGEGWQVWEAVSDGSPMTPVFATADELIDYLVDSGYSVDAASKFVLEDKWCPSMIIVGGRSYNNIESSGI